MLLCRWWALEIRFPIVKSSRFYIATVNQLWFFQHWIYLHYFVMFSFPSQLCQMCKVHFCHHIIKSHLTQWPFNCNIVLNEVNPLLNESIVFRKKNQYSTNSKPPSKIKQFFESFHFTFVFTTQSGYLFLVFQFNGNYWFHSKQMNSHTINVYFRFRYEHH